LALTRGCLMLERRWLRNERW